jgi:AraC family transcriptional regulator
MNIAAAATGAGQGVPVVAREITARSSSVLERVIRARSGDLFAAQLAHQPLEIELGAMPMHVVGYHIEGSTDVEKRVHGRVTGRRPRIGSVSLIPGGVETGWRIGGATRVAHPYVPQAHLDSYCRDDLGLEVRPEVIDFFDAADPWLNAFFTLLLADASAVSAVGEEVDSLLLDQLRQRLVRHLVENYTTIGKPRSVVPGCGATARLRPVVLRRVIELIDSRLSGEIRIKELASIACLSVDHFTRCFRATFGCTPYQYVLSRRIERAKTLLRDGELPIAAVSERAGFGSVSHFSNTFLRSVGSTPTAFRRQACSGRRAAGAIG